MVRYILSPHLSCFIAFLDVSQCNESVLVDGESEEAMFVLPHISWKRPTQGDLDFQVWGLINISAFLSVAKIISDSKSYGCNKSYLMLK